MSAFDWRARLQDGKLIGAALAASYPLFAGLYIIGFFWALPFDLVTAFPFTDFLQKSAIVFLGIAAFCIIYVATILIYYHTIIERVVGPEQKQEAKAKRHNQWKDLSKQRIAVILVTSLFPVLIFAVVFFLSEIEDRPHYLPETLPFVLVFAVFLSPLVALSLDAVRWIMVKSIYIATVVITVPVAIGFQDSQQFDQSNRNILIDLEGEDCPAIFMGTESALVRCADNDYLVRTESGTFRFDERP